MLVPVSTPASVAELRALYRKTRAHFAAAEKAAEAARPRSAAPPTMRFRLRQSDRPQGRFSGRTTLRIVARHFGLRPEALAGAARLRRLVVARWVVMHICVEIGGYTATDAGRLIGRDHTTVIYGLRELAALLARDAELADDVTGLMARCTPRDPQATAVLEGRV
jgi:chromosomal replication initiation ATPase DnaA